MPVTLNTPLSWESATGDDAAMLDSLQPNILKAHTREFLTLLFLRFDDRLAARKFLRELAGTGGTPLMKSARTHLQEVKAFKQSGTPGTSYVGLGLTARGYTKLGIAAASQPSDPAFKAGMQNAGLGDPPVAAWDAPFRDGMDAVLLVGDQLKKPRDKTLARVRRLLDANPKVVVLGEQTGHGLHNSNGEGIEHFGYVDGRSQPIFLTEDLTHEKLREDGTTNWDPAFGPGLAIVPDRAAPKPATQFGSYFVYRKLEQNVRLFKRQEEKLAARLKLTGADAERAGAMLVGRFEDGTPLASQFADGAESPVPNDFNYDSDPEGAKCPFFAHIRKVNPRGTGGFEAVAQERRHLMARRGQTYGVRTDDPNDGKTSNKPTDDVGLLFMAFNVDIAAQFAFAQGSWANNAGFPKVPTGFTPPGLDPVIGQGARSDIDCPLTWGADMSQPSQHKLTSPVPQSVTMKGGEYYFMPSLAFLRAL